MSNLGCSWERNVSNTGKPAGQLFYPECLHTVLVSYPPVGMAPKPASLLNPAELSTESAALTIIIKEE
jgi:hypothetical protein